MVFDTTDDFQVRCIGAVVPPSEVSNLDLVQGQERSEYWQSLAGRMGVSRRFVCDQQEYSSDLAEYALRQVLTAEGWSPSELAYLVVVTQTPDTLFPGISHKLHEHLDLDEGTAVFDVNLGCSGFVYGTWILSSLLRSKPGFRGALVVVDTMSRVLEPFDVGNRLLFGDGATAVLAECKPGDTPVNFLLGSDGRGTSSVSLDFSGMRAVDGKASEFVLNGPAVLSLALKKVPKLLSELRVNDRVTAGVAADLVVPHQANGYILDLLEKRLGGEFEMLNEIRNFGNTSGASIGVSLCSRFGREGRIQPSHVNLVGFGTGFSWGAASLDLGECRILPVVTTSGRHV
jgi:3-oxoacyl-[acyl-carrier-protein] synthase-3